MPRAPAVARAVLYQGANAAVSDIFQEVDEELRRDNFAKLWKRYGNYVVALAVLIVAATGAFSWWRAHDLQQRQDEGTRAAAALTLAAQGKTAEAADALTVLSSDAHAGRALVARFETAALRARAGDPAAAIAAYDSIAKDGAVDQIYRDLATLSWAFQAIDSLDPSVIIERLAPLTAADSPWHPSAIELTAIAHLKAGDRNAARTDYQRLADDLTAPQGLRARAAQMVAALGS
ncbi:MAG TPA: tetratricopeptide repeat protein [Stellaceae bacterium]|nr:tetratricopeptide repeat protein [Stellaceae bacterium]